MEVAGLVLATCEIIYYLICLISFNFLSSAAKAN